MENTDLKEKLLEIIEEVKASDDKDDIKLSLCMLKDVFLCLLEVAPEKAKELLQGYEGSLRYYNFLTEEEAEKIVASFVNSDGSKGAKWGMDELFAKVEEFGGKVDYQPYYNKYALYAVMNMYDSDHSSVINKWTNNSATYPQICYDFAVSTLKDKDRQYWVRDYFHLGKSQDE